MHFYLRVLGVHRQKEAPDDTLKPVSIVICARNEAANLIKHLPAILEQVYSHDGSTPLFEVLVVNDCSTDDTSAVLARLQANYSHLRTVTVPAEGVRELKGKKHALSYGVAHARYDWLLLTDADCSPASTQWLAKMAAPLAAGKELVAGHGAYNKSTGLLNAFIRWETINSFVQGYTYALAGKPYLAVGRNMACTRAIFLKAEQNKVWNISASGDDDLVVNLYGTPTNYAMVTDPAAFTYTDTPTRLRDFINQKQRHLTDGKSYRGDVKYWLSTYGFTHAAVWFYFIPLLFTSYAQPAIIFMAARCAAYWVIWAVAAFRLKEKKVIYLLPVFDIGWMIFNIAFSPYIILKNKQHWT